MISVVELLGQGFDIVSVLKIVIVSVGGRKMFSISNLDKGIVSSGSWRSKT